MKAKNLAWLWLVACLIFTSNTQAGFFGPRDCEDFGKSGADYNGFGYDERRGHPSEFDPGPNPNTRVGVSWLKLFGQIPNYRKVGKYIMEDNAEIFRWDMGPMWYRGRLGKNEVKVFLVGQEGAQDENITNRAFTGSTGTRVQKFLNHMGIYESYIFLNTFVYTLNFFSLDGVSNGGQRVTEKNIPKKVDNYVALEQGWKSPIVQYRHALFDNVVKQNPDTLKLIMAVGGGAKDSLATWIHSRGGIPCNKNKIDKCNLTGFVKHFKDQGIEIKNDLRALSVVHPGSAKFPGGMANVQRSFDAAAATARSISLDADSQAPKFAKCNGSGSGFNYGYAPIPFRDFSFATNWRNGKAGTTSNRNGSDRILVFSEKGDYEESKPGNASKAMKFEGRDVPREATSQLRDADKGLVYGMKDNEVAYEHPRYAEFSADLVNASGDLDHVKKFDAGPNSKSMALALMNWPDFTQIDEEAFVSHPSFGFGPSYRGNTKDPEVVVIADQMSHTDMFSTRALTGTGGQRLQTFFEKTGLGGKYLILRSLPMDTLGVSTADKIKLATEQDRKKNSAVKTIKAIISKVSGSPKILAMGPVAQKIAEEANLSNVVKMDLPEDGYDHAKNWVNAAKAIGKSVSEDDLKAMYVIPREDLPYSTRWWMGTTGDTASRGEAKKSGTDKYKGHYYRLEAPKWVKGNMKRNDPRPLSAAEKTASDDAMKDQGL